MDGGVYDGEKSYVKTQFKQNYPEAEIVMDTESMEFDTEQKIDPKTVYPPHWTCGLLK